MVGVDEDTKGMRVGRVVQGDGLQGSRHVRGRPSCMLRHDCMMVQCTAVVVYVKGDAPIKTELSATNRPKDRLYCMQAHWLALWGRWQHSYEEATRRQQAGSGQQQAHQQHIKPVLLRPQLRSRAPKSPVRFLQATKEMHIPEHSLSHAILLPAPNTNVNVRRPESMLQATQRITPQQPHKLAAVAEMDAGLTHQDVGQEASSEYGPQDDPHCGRHPPAGHEGRVAHDVQRPAGSRGHDHGQ